MLELEGTVDALVIVAMRLVWGWWSQLVVLKENEEMRRLLSQGRRRDRHGGSDGHEAHEGGEDHEDQEAC